MNGAEALIRTAVSAGVDLCLANPGTTEMQLVAALDAAPGIRAVLALFEGVCTGAADGYARMTVRPALTRSTSARVRERDREPAQRAARALTIVNLIGDHASWPLARTRAHLGHRLARRAGVGLGAQVRDRAYLPGDGADAIAAALDRPARSRR